MRSKKMPKLFEIIDKITRLSQNMDDEIEKISPLERDLMLKYIEEMRDYVAILDVNDQTQTTQKENISKSELIQKTDLETDKIHVKSEIEENTEAQQIENEVESYEQAGDETENTSLEINEIISAESKSLNDIHKESDQQTENREVVLDLNKKIGFINELFSGNSNDFESMLRKVRKYESADEAQLMIEDTMSSLSNWKEHPTTASDFVSYIRQIVQPGNMRVAK
ncbi:MAG: hypothetical protein HKN92_08365 [Chitinophagales bacterium]|nr:hypothetical protein [Chitinophagales bacterium]